ncbi:MAG: DoxX family protein [Cyclobacteriaceae bacterium]|nr:DoxX family protein [Cyclobacteriaceae bacterium]
MAYATSELISSRPFRIIFTALRMLIGWHLLYEGILKIIDPAWTSAAYLAGSTGILSGFFQWIVDSSVMLTVVDALNVWGLTVIGFALIIGYRTRFFGIAGALLLFMYYMAYPPVIGRSGLSVEGNYLFVDKNLIESILLLGFATFSNGYLYGLDRILNGSGIKLHPFERKNLQIPDQEEIQGELNKLSMNRRELIKNLSALPVLGLFGFGFLKKKQWMSLEEKKLVAMGGTDAVTSATLKTFHFSKLEDLRGTLPMGKIGNLEVSRLFMGGNLIGGWAHARDLIYVSKLVKSYHSDEKVIHTMQLAEQCGINTLLTNPQLNRIINKYWRETKGKMQFISDCGISEDLLKGVQMSIDGGAHACYSQGEISDQLVRDGDFDTLARALYMIRQNGLPAGIGAHRLETIQGCVEKGLKPDFWVKTLHHHNYWSASPAEWNDNMYCFKPAETIQFMSGLEEPWIAFKILAAGSIAPEEGFRYAFENGADFICVGMYDFQIVDDVNIALDTLNGLQRNRPWRA